MIDGFVVAAFQTSPRARVRTARNPCFPRAFTGYIRRPMVATEWCEWKVGNTPSPSTKLAIVTRIPSWFRHEPVQPVNQAIPTPVFAAVQLYVGRPYVCGSCA